MLTLRFEETEMFDEGLDQFIKIPPLTLRLEHSLVSLSKWESRFERSFLTGKEKTHAETMAYIEAMVIDDKNAPYLLSRLTSQHFDAVNEYINARMTATTFREINPRRGGPKEPITAELIYYWMISYNIDWQAQHWHLERLLALIRVCNIKNTPAKKLSKREAADAAAERRRLNQERRAKFGTRG